MLARETKTPERRSATGTVTIVVEDVNDNRPNFVQTGNYQVSIPETQAIGSSVLQVEVDFI